MFWIDGITRTPSGLVLDTLSPNAPRLQRPLHDLAVGPKVRQTRRARITTHCLDWKITSAAPFWQWLGIPAGVPRDAQTIFEIVDDRHYLVPASVLIASLMRPIKHVQAFLFRPQGLDVLCTPILDGASPTVGLHLPLHRVFGSGARPPAGLLASYAWMHCFPSARAMWDSVFIGGAEGILTVAPPNAKMQMILHSVTCQGYELVTEAVIMWLEPTEAPFEFAGSYPPRIALHDNAAINDSMRYPSGGAVPPRGSGWALSDAEWTALQNVLPQRARVRFELRDIIDVILTKLGTGQAWRKVDCGALNSAVVQGTYQRMNKDGRWRAVETLLSSYRAQPKVPV